MALAQGPLSGPIWDGNGGPLLAGQVYTVANSFTVPTGQTLTVQPGAIVRIAAGTLAISGTLDVLAGANQTVFTSAEEVSASAAPGDWGGILVQAGSVVNLRNTRVSYGGATGWANVYMNGGSVLLDSCVLSSCSGPGLEANNLTAALTVVDCAFEDNSGWAIEELPIQLLDGFSGNTASGNAAGDAIALSSISLAEDLSLSTDNVINDVLFSSGAGTVQPGFTLTLGPGLGIKFGGGLFSVSGNLQLDGTALNPVLLTSIDDDDAFFGDTPKDGPSAGAPGDWGGLAINTGGSLDAQHAILRHAGQSGWAPVYMNGGTAQLYSCVVERSSSPGVEGNNLFASLVIEDTAFFDNQGFAMDEIQLVHVPNFSNNSAAGNALGDAIRLASASLSTNVTVTLDNLINGVLINPSALSVLGTALLTLEQGVVVKSLGGLWSVAGNLQLNGTAAQPVVLTSYEDDSVLGDTLKDGATVGAPGDWGGIASNTGGSVSATHGHLRFCGQSGWAPIYLNGGSVDLLHCKIESSSGPGIDGNNLSVPITVAGSEFLNNLGTAVIDVPVALLPGFDSNTAAGNSGGDAIHVTTQVVSSSVTIDKRNLLANVFVAPSGFSVVSPANLTLRPGVTIKVGTGLISVGNGAVLHAEGTGIRPVTLTSLNDDTVGGDTNLDGAATLPAPADWSGLLLNAGSIATLENLVVRYAGQNGWEGLRATAPEIAMRAVRVEHCAGVGMRFFDLQSDAYNLVAFDNASSGILIDKGTGDLLHATSVGNGGTGIRGAAIYSGVVRNSVAWANFQGNYALVDMVFSNGDVTASGSNGNLNLDPQFVDASAGVGDLRLQPGSPLVGSADFATAVATIKDFGENSRVTSTTTAPIAADMGAYQRVLWRLQLTGDSNMGEPISLVLNGTPGGALMILGFLNGTALNVNYGMSLAGSSAVLVLNTKPVGVASAYLIPDSPILLGLNFGIQGFSFAGFDPNIAHVSNVVRLRIGDELP